MKQHISTLFMLIAIVLGFAACTDADMGTNVTYDEHQALTSWQSEYLEDSTECNITYSLNAKGDTICTMAFTAVKSDGSIARLLCNDGQISYDNVTGMTTIDFATTPLGYPLRIYSILQSNKKYSSVQIFLRVPYTNNGKTEYYESKYESFRAINTKPELKGQLWVSNDESYAFIFDEEGKLTYMIPGVDTVGEGTYTYDITTGNGTITLADGSAATIYVNSLNQVIVNINGTDVVLYSSVL